MSTVTLTLQLPNGEQLLYPVPTRETAGAHQHECALYCHHRKAINALIREKLNLEPNTVSIMLHHNLEEELLGSGMTSSF